MHRTISRVLVALIFTGALSTAAYADAIHVGDSIKFADGPGTTGGGEFLVTVSNGGTVLDSFITFCLQRTEYIDYSTTFRIGGINEYAMTDPVANGGDSVKGFDYISPHTAYLYTHFRAGTLSGYDYNSSNRWVSANHLQNAIWWFEQEISTSQSSNPFVVLATNAVNSGAWSGIGNVRVINLFFPNGAEAQDQLALIDPPASAVVPEPTTLALLGLGLGVGAWRRFRKGRRS
jgi:hypothetical protein